MSSIPFSPLEATWRATSQPDPCFNTPPGLLPCLDRRQLTLYSDASIGLYSLRSSSCPAFHSSCLAKVYRTSLPRETFDRWAISICASPFTFHLFVLRPSEPHIPCRCEAHLTYPAYTADHVTSIVYTLRHNKVTCRGSALGCARGCLPRAGSSRRSIETLTKNTSANTSVTSR